MPSHFSHNIHRQYLINASRWESFAVTSAELKGNGSLTTPLSFCQHLHSTTTSFLTSLLPYSPTEQWSHRLHSINCLHYLLWSLTCTRHPARAAPCGVLTIIRHFVVKRTHNVHDVNCLYNRLCIMSDHWPKNTVEILTWQKCNPDLVCIYWYKSGSYDCLQYSFC